MIIDEKVNCTHHISYIKNKVSKGMGIIIKTRNYSRKIFLLDTVYRRHCYYTFLVDILLGDMGWGGGCGGRMDSKL